MSEPFHGMLGSRYGIEVFKSEIICTFCMANYNRQLVNWLMDYWKDRIFVCEKHYQELKQATRSTDDA